MKKIKILLKPIIIKKVKSSYLEIHPEMFISAILCIRHLMRKNIHNIMYINELIEIEHAGGFL